MTLLGYLAIAACALLILVMGWLGWTKRWFVAVGLTLPFIALLVWIELTTAGPPIHQDPYGIMLIGIVLSPIALGWIAFLLSRLSLLLSAAKNRD